MGPMYEALCIDLGSLSVLWSEMSGFLPRTMILSIPELAGRGLLI